MSLIDAPYALSYRVSIGHEPPNRLLTEIFSVKVACGHTNMSTDNKGRLKLAKQQYVAGEPYACGTRYELWYVRYKVTHSE